MSTLPPLPALASVLAAEGLPPLTGWSALGVSGPLERHRLVLADGRRLDLTRVRWDSVDAPLKRALASVTVLRDEEVPVAPGLRILPEEALGRPASLEPSPQGASAVTLIRADPTKADWVLGTLGRVLGALQHVPLLGFGTRADLGRFTAVRSTWAEEWASFATAHRVALERAGLGDLPEATALWEALQAGFDALEQPSFFGPVHFGLRPASLTVDRRGEELGLLQVGEWEQGLAGDPLAGWAPVLLRFHGRALGLILEAAGDPGGAALRERSSALATYCRTRALVTLADAAERARHAPDTDAALAVQRAVHACATWAEPDHMERVLDGLASPTPIPPAPSPASVLRTRVALLLGSGPALPSDRGAHVLGALASADLADRAEPDHFAAVGSLFVDRARPGPGALAVDPLTGPEAWRAALVEQVATACEHAGPGLALALLAAGLHALDTTVAPASSRRGLEALVRASLANERGHRQGGTLPAVDRLIHGLLGQDAALRLNLQALSTAYQNQVVDALDAAGVVRSAPKAGDRKPGLDALLPVLTKPAVYTGRAAFQPAVAAAIARLGEAGALVDQPVSLLAACFR